MLKFGSWLGCGSSQRVPAPSLVWSTWYVSANGKLKVYVLHMDMLFMVIDSQVRYLVYSCVKSTKLVDAQVWELAGLRFLTARSCAELGMVYQVRGMRLC